MEDVDASHVQAALQQLADLGNTRRDEISTAVDTEADEPQGGGQLFQKSIGQTDHSACLNEWSALHSTIGDIEEELGSLMGGQSHREKLSKELLQSWIGQRGQQHHHQRHYQRHHRTTKHGMQQLRRGYQPVYNDAPKAASKPMPPPFYSSQSPTVTPSLGKRSPSAANQASIGRHTASKTKTAPKPLSAPEEIRTAEISKAIKPSQALPKLPRSQKLLEIARSPSSLKQQPAFKGHSHPTTTTSKSHNQVELTGFNLPQPQTNSETIQRVNNIEGDLLSFDNCSSGSPRGKDPIITSHSAISDLLEINDGNMLTKIPGATGLQVSGIAPPITHDVTELKPEHKQMSGLIASKYATSDAKSTISNSTASGAKGQGKEIINTANRIDFWQKALPRSVQDIIHEKCESHTTPKNVSGGLATSRWAH